MSQDDERTPADLYAILGVSSGATAEEITAAYRRLVRALHPDSAPVDGDARALHEVVAAHRILSDTRRRRDYDDRGSRQNSRSAAVAQVACRTCNGTGRVELLCRRCAGKGFVLLDTAWLQTPIGCASCAGRGYRRVVCAACGRDQRRFFAVS